MIIDLERSPPVDQTTYDVCIVGAGAAGIALAVELRRRGRRVLLLESGGLGYESRTQALYAGETDGLAYPGLTDGRFRVLGGSTSQWGGQILEIDEHVFGPRPWAPGGEWPFAKAELAPHYRRAIALEGLDRALDDADAVWRALERPRPDFGQELFSAFSLWCPVTDFSRLHGKALREDAGLSIYLHANAIELVFAEDGQTARQVRCRTLGGKSASFSAETFVLCMGGIETSRFLLQPPTETNAAPWRDNALIGRHFQDHISCFVATIADCGLQPPAAYFDYQSAGGLRYHPKIKLSPKTQSRLGLLDICGTVVVTNAGQDDLAVAFETYRLLRTRRFDSLSALRLAHFALNLPRLLWHKVPFSRSASGATPSRNRVLRLCLHCEQSPVSESRVSLSAERDALNQPRARVSWRASAQELQSIRAYVGVAQQAFAAQALGQVVADPGVMDDDAALAATFNDSSHHIGGTRMATFAASGVVDPNLRLFGTRNAYVCSSSVFPSAGFVNPTHTIIALAARLAEHLSPAN
jgi:choline dehydrogenase-like flavoprotein